MVFSKLSTRKWKKRKSKQTEIVQSYIEAHADRWHYQYDERNTCLSFGLWHSHDILPHFKCVVILLRLIFFTSHSCFRNCWQYINSVGFVHSFSSFIRLCVYMFVCFCLCKYFLLAFAFAQLFQYAVFTIYYRG